MKVVPLGHYGEPAVLVTPTDVWVAMDGGRLVRLDREGSVQDVLTGVEGDLPGGALSAFIKPKFAGDRWLATQAPDDTACTLRDLTTGAVRVLGPSAGEIATNERYAAWKDLLGMIWRAALPDGQAEQIRPTTAAMGLAYVDEQDRVWDWDEARLRFGLLNARPCGDAWVGEGADSGMMILRGGVTHMLALGETCIMPRGSYGDGLYAIVAWDGNPGGQVRVWLLTADEIDALPVLPVPPPPQPPVISLRVPVVKGPAPLDVDCSAAVENAVTWRWLLDDAIVQIDGATRTYHLPEPGRYSVGVRAANVAGVRDERRAEIEVTAPAIGFRGLSVGITRPSGPQALRDLREHAPWVGIVRYDCAPKGGKNPHRASTPAEMAEIVRQAREAGLAPCLLALASQVADVPEYSVVELRAFVDASDGGLEPNFDRAHPAAQQAAEINRWMPIARARHLDAYALGGNTDGSADAWHRELVAALDPDVGLSAHPYPLGGARGHYDRSGELASLKAIAGARRFCVGEWGVTQGPIDDPAPRFGWAWFAWLFGKRTHWHLSDERRAEWIDEDFEMWEAGGATFACLYQILDGEPCPRHPTMPATVIEGYGIRRADGSWKRVVR